MSYLALLFGDQLGLAFLNPSRLASFRAGGVRYRDAGAGDLVSHYDRLTNGAGRLLGFQLWALPEEAGVGRALAMLPPRPYVQHLGEFSVPCFRVYLAGAPPAAEPADMGNQAFGGQLFFGERGEVALSLDLDYLCGGPGEEADLAAIRHAPGAAWPAVTELVAAGMPEA